MRTAVGKYSIGTAAQRTGLSPFTLRAWEKRYGVPRPSRSRSRYRYYSDADLLEIRWMAARVADGIPPRQAARLVRERRRAGLPFEDVGIAADPTALAADLRVACLAFDDDRAQEVIHRAAAAMAPTQVVRTVLLPTVAMVGEDFIHGQATVAQEHFASQVARRFTERLLDLYPPRAGAPEVLLACAPGEQHELGLLALAAELRSLGYRVTYLGAMVPVNALVATIESRRPAAALVAVVLDRHLRPLVDEREAIRAAVTGAGTTMLWGGPGAATPSAQRLPGTVVRTIDEALARLHPLAAPR
ncbi:MAG: MerR family transcriptional regulator [Armatimonadota bacterium]|nr:MerR family transcriptional regulator [Armatimonadota bacterium]